MPSDRSRPPDPAADAYTGVAYQQGRVTLDRDFNTLREIIDRRADSVASALVGPCGTPDNGFAILPPPLLFHPILPLRPLIGEAPISLPIQTPIQGPIQRPIITSPPSDGYAFRIRSGTMFLGGVRVAWPGNPDGSAAEYSYYSQPDWLIPDPPAAPQTEIVYLHVAEHEVSAAEDPELYDVALGGPDTTQRLRLQRTVHRQAVAASSCAPGWQALLNNWQILGWGFDAKTMRLVPQAQMKVAFVTPPGSSGPCDPVASGGYLGAENQLIRVKWAPSAPGATSGTLIWGFDDASFIYRASADPAGLILTLTRNPPDAYHFPGAGQYVEVLRTTSLLGAGASEQAADGSTIVPRCVAEETGFVTTLAAAYDPTNSAQTLTLSQALPASYGNSTEPLFVRIWQGGGAMGPAGGVLELVDPVANASTGVTVTLTVPSGSAIAPGSFWMMALRPGTPQNVLPAALVAAPQPPDGPRSWACPLAVVEWPSGSLEPVIHDCRVQFDDLISLTQRPAGCCTVSVSPADITLDYTLQTAINGLTAPGTLCLAPGTYALAAPLQIGAAQMGLTIVAENGATLTAASGSESAFGNGLIVVAGAPQVTLRGLTLQPPAAAIPSGLFNNLTNLSRIALPAMQAELLLLLQQAGTVGQNLSTMIGVRAGGCPSLTIENCTVQFNPPATATGALVAIGVLAGGACAGLIVRGCNFAADALTVTQTQGVTQTSGFLGASGFLAPAGVPTSMQAAFGILASPYAAQFLSPLLSPPVLASPPQIVPIRTLIPLPIEAHLPAAPAAPAVRLEPDAIAARPAIETAAPAPDIRLTQATDVTATDPKLTTAAGAVGIVANPVSTGVNPVLTGVNPVLLGTQGATLVPQLPLKTIQPVNSNLLNTAIGAPTIDPTLFTLDLSDVFTSVLDLNGAAFVDNVFDSVTVAVSAFGMLDRVRVANNSVVNSGAGFWLRPIEQSRFIFTTSATLNQTSPVPIQDPVVSGDSMWLKLAMLQQEIFIGWLLSVLLPPPAGALSPTFGSPAGGVSLQVTGNNVAALAGGLSTAAANAAPWGAPALAVVTGNFASGVDVGPGMVIANNRLQARTPASYPAVVLAVSGRVAATGNLISAEQSASPPGTGTALAIYPQNNENSIQGTIAVARLCVTGNVLEGASNLGQLIRADAQAPLNTWLAFNSSN